MTSSFCLILDLPGFTTISVTSCSLIAVTIRKVCHEEYLYLDRTMTAPSACAMVLISTAKSE